MELKGRAAIVTGGTRGVGRATALALAELGDGRAIPVLVAQANHEDRDTALDAIEAALQKTPWQGHRHVLQHLLDIRRLPDARSYHGTQPHSICVKLSFPVDSRLIGGRHVVLARLFG